LTAICGGATSSAKPGWDRVIYVTPFLLGALLNNVPTRIALTLAGAVGSLSFDLNQFCPNDPPDMPTITVDDVAAILNPAVIDQFIPARQKFQDWLTHLLWIQACQCNAGPQPAAPSVPTAIANFDANPATGPAVGYGGHCLDVQARGVDYSGVTPLHDATGHANYYALTQFLLAPNGPSLSVDNTGLRLIPTFRVPANVQSFTLQVHAYGPAPNDQSIFVEFWNASGVRVANAGANIAAPNTNYTITGNNLTSSALYCAVYIVQQDAEAAICITDLELTFDGPCGSPATMPCCPPDESLNAQIAQILGYVQLIQRQNAPFGYIRSTSHEALSGDGHIDVQGLLGCIVQLDTIPSQVGSTDGDELAYHGVGWINWVSPDGALPREWISASPQISLPRAAGQYARISYSFSPGVVAHIVELVREP
jgi:hypothetical protein